MKMLLMIVMVLAPAGMAQADAIVEDTAEASYARAAAQDVTLTEGVKGEDGTVDPSTQTTNFGGAGHRGDVQAP